MVDRLCLVFLAVIATASGRTAYWSAPDNLQPVHGLYVKPSMDGTTGDLYVAATEENGVKSQWLTDQPVNFLPVAAAHTQPTVAYPPNIANSDETANTQKRAVVNPPLQYAYAYPVPGNPEGNSIVSYPYPVSASNALPSNPTEIRNTGDAPASTTLPQYNPFHYFYPQIISAYADLLNNLKETGNTEEATGSVTNKTPAAWPPTYAYPVQYVMVDPSLWAQSQTASGVSTTSTTSAGVPVIDNE
ncbi:uncharacterized protein LOC113517362 [Galleria mellonella]|uniref:Uncharacterized protein LOC113517362 n=1 Tax=Galleria mellonella TaxID=7137 RepID=A0A6J1WXT2_GALME|nr:uncharacterized protein LOC113517362 [Galleria mellonella]